MDTIVIIEDEKHVQDMLRYLMELNNFKVESYSCAEDFFLAKRSQGHYVYLVDSRLPGIQGEDVIRTIRTKDKISPVFMISGNSDDPEITNSLRCGADDYVLKPFNPDHLMAKIRNATERTSLIIKNLMNVGVKLLPEANSVIVDGETISLTSREFKIMNLLLSHKNEIITRESMVSNFEDNEVTTRTIDVHISSLRKKFLRSNINIETMRGQGYRVSL